MTSNHVLSTSLQSRWLAAVLTGAVLLPDKAEQQADVDAQKVSSDPFFYVTNRSRQAMVLGMRQEAWHVPGLLLALFSRQCAKQVLATVLQHVLSVTGGCSPP